MHVRDPFESKCQLLINRREEVGIKELNNPKAFIDYSQTLDDIYKISKAVIHTKKTNFDSVWWYL